MTYTPKTEEQLAKEGLLQFGIYHAEVLETSDRPSKKGNAMFTLKLRVFDEDGNSRHIFDYIALGNNFGERKLRHAALACGLEDTYLSGKLVADDFLNTMCQVEVKQQEGTPDYPTPKNVVSDYIERGVEVKKPAAAPAKKPPVSTLADDDGLNDSVPF